MAVAIQRLLPNRIIGDSLVVSSGAGRLGGMVTINATGDINIEPGFITGLNGYFYTYKIVTDLAINVNLPPNVVEGWKCKIILSTPNDTGVLTIKDSSVITILNTGFGPDSSCNFIKSGTILTPWRVSYNRPNSGLGILMYYPNYPNPRPINTGIFFAYSGTTSINVNVSTAAGARIPWEFNYPGRYVDDTYFVPQPASNTRIQFNRPNLVLSVRAIVSLLNRGTSASITPANTRMFIYFDGGNTGLTNNFQQLSSNRVLDIILIYEGILSTGTLSFVELGITKTSTGIGTNPTIPANTYIEMRVLRS
jgi:hypothetical protein